MKRKTQKKKKRKKKTNSEVFLVRKKLVYMKQSKNTFSLFAPRGRGRVLYIIIWYIQI